MGETRQWPPKRDRRAPRDERGRGGQPRGARAWALVAFVALAACGEDARPLAPPPAPPSPDAHPGSISPGAGYAPPPTCIEGATRACKIILSEHEGVVTCFVGVQRCAAGSWGPCEDGARYEADELDELVAPGGGEAGGSAGGEAGRAEGGGGLEQENAGALEDEAGSTEAGGHVFRSLSLPSECAHNPCDPGCVNHAEVPAASISPKPQQIGTYQAQPTLGYLPGGFEDKALKDPNHPPTSARCDEPGDCQIDHKCNHSTGLCQPWGTSEVDPVCNGANLTIAPPCTSDKVPVCNRGTQTAVPPTGGIEVLAIDGNSTQLQDNLGLCSSFHGSIAGRCHVTESIPAGQCRDAVCPAGLLSGTRALVVNPPKPAALVDPIAECACGDNWSVYSSGGSCETRPIMDTLPMTFAETYVASCPPGTIAQWGHLAYSASTPSTSAGTSTVKIEGRTLQSPAAFPDSTTCGSDCITLADVPAADPQSCPLAGPEPCPKDLFRAFALPQGRHDQLQLVFTLTPSPFGTPPVFFEEDFASNDQGWTLGPEWQIGATKASTGHSHQGPDPVSDNTATADNGVAGAVLGGNVSATLHGFYYLTSPVIPLDVPGNVTLEYFRWLNSDFSPYQTNVVEVWNGASWMRIFESGGSPGIADSIWRRITHDVTAYKNANFRVRFGHDVSKKNSWVVSGWNLDDIRIYGDAPGKVSPSLHDWQVSYSCVDSE